MKPKPKKVATAKAKKERLEKMIKEKLKRHPVEEEIIVRICELFAKNSGSINDPALKNGILEISLSDYVKYIEWDCKNLCLYYPDFKNPPPIMGLKVRLKKSGKLKISKND